jgi:hypothetical protein
VDVSAEREGDGTPASERAARGCRRSFWRPLRCRLAPSGTESDEP